MGKKRILIVDDSKTALMMTQMILRRHPYELITAVDGRDGVEKAVAENPDLILMDVVMPNMDGFSAVKAIRSIESVRAIPIIMVTTRGEVDNVERGYDRGCNDYITKPVDGVELLAKIVNLIGQ
jgi:DNA-binding response OmpR family regulator